jgi:hypothetical protein
MRRNQLIAFAFIIALMSAACSKTKPVTETKTEETQKENSISDELTVLNDSVDAAWDRMMAADSQKFADIKRLIEEISYCKKYDEKAVENLLKLTKEVDGMRYTQATVSDSLIDLYDSKTSDLINKVRNLKSKTPEIMQHPLADQLENEIMKADGDDLLLYRKKYDQIAGAYNSFLDVHKEAIAADSVLKDNKKKKLFSVVL